MNLLINIISIREKLNNSVSISFVTIYDLEKIYGEEIIDKEKNIGVYDEEQQFHCILKQNNKFVYYLNKGGQKELSKYFFDLRLKKFNNFYDIKC